MASLTAGSMILGYADELIMEYKAKMPPGFHFETLEDKLAATLEKIIRYVREDDGEP